MDAPGAEGIERGLRDVEVPVPHEHCTDAVSALLELQQLISVFHAQRDTALLLKTCGLSLLTLNSSKKQ